MTDPRDKQLEHSAVGTTDVYFVEVRHVGTNVMRVAGMDLTDSWQRLRVVRSSIGVPDGIILAPGAERAGFVSHGAAEALAAWFRAMPHDSGMIPYTVETRIVRCTWKYEIAATRMQDGPAISSLDQRRAYLALAKEEQ